MYHSGNSKQLNEHQKCRYDFKKLKFQSVQTTVTIEKFEWHDVLQALLFVNICFVW